MIEVFKTDINSGETAAAILEKLQFLFPGYAVNFDLEDCDRILRVESEKINKGEVISILNDHGFNCEELPD